MNGSEVSSGAEKRGGPTKSVGPENTVLVVGTDDWAIDQAATELEHRGFAVLRCHEPGQPAFPCNALIEGRSCPLDVGFGVVADVRARPLTNLSQPEFGVVCALHHGHPLVVAGLSQEIPLGPWAARKVTEGKDLATTCEEVLAGADPNPRTIPEGSRNQ